MFRPRPSATDEHEERLAPAYLADKRLLVRRDRVMLPFVWRGLLPLVGLLVVIGYGIGPFARDGIETQVHAETRSALDLRGFRWVDLRVNGQSVHLSGMPPVPAAAEEARRVAAAATCGTWAGRRPCATEVWTHFSAPRTANPALITPLGPADAQVAGSPSTNNPGSSVASASPGSVASNVAMAPAAGAAGASSPAVAARACEQRIGQLLTESRIQFETGDAVIAATSQLLLDELARIVRTCPGVVRIEGHTDNVGSAPKNQALSLERAFAVRDALVARGLAPTQLVAEGYGSTRPVDNNGTEKGRSANRRIEFRVMTLPAR